MRKALLLAGVLFAPTQLQAQDTELALDFRPFSGVLSIAWRTSDAWAAGIGLGAGIDYLDFTPVPNTSTPSFHSFEQYIHASVFTRHKPSSRVDLDLGVRGGFGDVRECGSSDCWPGPYVGLYAGAFIGGRRWKVGPRLLIGHIYEHPYSDNVVYLEILTGRFSISW